MLQISVRFPRAGKAMRSGTFAALQQEIERRLTPRYPQLWLNIGKSSQTALDVSGARTTRKSRTS
jgi:DNA-damage-inducible protein I